ncbi:MAG: flavodoxin-dependent (E)-4-hydroxy-3-methylbut-2-enyl-diphosphate synthase [Oscillospiraceae bacterium]|nr:flavodoxin-dependent (E)-4-hydroxy-3-methylbut-2-enyl-diphosphate synthase [Oscillospiraceae bacterium]
MNKERNKKTKEIKIGNTYIGKNNKIAVQSMLSVPSYDTQANINQACELERSGCDIIRVAIPDEKALEIIKLIKNYIKIPVVADIHFDYRLAIKSVISGADKIRINPGNIGDKDKVKQVVDVCKKYNIPIRIGVNSGSVDKNILKKYNKCCPEAMVESAMYYIKLLESLDFENIVLSLKCSSVIDTVLSYRLISEKVSYPLHLGVTESGTLNSGVIKSSIGIGSLLLDGIGDTIRVSLTADPVEEVYVAKKILKNTGYLDSGLDIISCPTCGRTRINVIEIANKIEKELINLDKNLKIAIMGCVVNGPGEAKDADLGIAGGDGCAVLFKKGQIIKKIKETDIISELIKEIESF